MKIAGKADYLVDPNGDEDFYGRVIDLRQTVKDERRIGWTLSSLH